MSLKLPAVPGWVDLGQPDRPLLYFDPGSSAPWRDARHMTGTPWLLELRFMLDRGAIGWHQIREEVDARAVRPSLIAELRQMPHLNGYNAEIAEAFAASDTEVGFES